MSNKNKKCNKIVKTFHKKVPKSDITLRFEKFHGNCRYAGDWNPPKNLIRINALQPETKAKTTLNHECFHGAFCLMCRTMGWQNNKNNPLCRFSQSMDHDPLLFLLLPEYGIGSRWENTTKRQRFWSYIWFKLFKLLRWLSYMRLRPYFSDGYFDAPDRIYEG